jgi:hypothetical protein
MTAEQLIGLFGGSTIIATGLSIFISQLIQKKAEAKWEASTRAKIAAIEGEIQQRNNNLSHLIAAHAGSVTLVIEKKFKVVEHFWKAIMEIRKENQSTEAVQSFLLDDEIRKVYTDEGSAKVRENYFNNLNHHYDAATETAIGWKEYINNNRPFIGEKLYNLYFVYSTFSLRSTLLLFMNASTKKCTLWKDDVALVNMLKEHLSQEEIKFLLSKDFASYVSVLTLLETKIINEINYAITGTEAMDNSLSQVKRLENLFAITTTKSWKK